MSGEWVAGLVYSSSMYGADYLCLRTWMEGSAQYVELAELGAALPDGTRCAGEPFERTASIARCGFSSVRHARGGVERGDSTCMCGALHPMPESTR